LTISNQNGSSSSSSRMEKQEILLSDYKTKEAMHALFQSKGFVKKPFHVIAEQKNVLQEKQRLRKPSNTFGRNSPLIALLRMYAGLGFCAVLIVFFLLRAAQTQNRVTITDSNQYYFKSWATGPETVICQARKSQAQYNHVMSITMRLGCFDHNLCNDHWSLFACVSDIV
jgi:hypothetical protein